MIRHAEHLSTDWACVVGHCADYVSRRNLRAGWNGAQRQTEQRRQQRQASLPILYDKGFFHSTALTPHTESFRFDATHAANHSVSRHR